MGLIFKATVFVHNPYTCTIPKFTTHYTLIANGRTSEIATGKIPPKLLKSNTRTVVEVSIAVHEIGSLKMDWRYNAMAKVQYKVANALDKLKYEITDVDLEGITREGFIFKAKLLVENPFTRDIPTSTISYTFKINERVIATGTIPPKSLKANVKTKMEVPIEIAYKNIPNLGKELYIILAETYVIKCELDLVLTFIGEQCILLTIKGEKKVPSKSQLGKMLINSWKEKIKDVKMVSYAKRLV
ncbi:unnamed protein product [Camellia sinensis]